MKADDDWILTCFLEYGTDHLEVHDILNERHEAGWQLKVSSYSKLRLSPPWVSGALQAHGFTVRVGPGLAGMVRTEAIRL